MTTLRRIARFLTDVRVVVLTTAGILTAGAALTAKSDPDPAPAVHAETVARILADSVLGGEISTLRYYMLLNLKMSCWALRLQPQMTRPLGVPCELILAGGSLPPAPR